MDLDNSLECEHSSIRFSKKLSLQNGENAASASEALVQVILTTKASEKWSAFFFLFFYQCHRKLTSPVHDMNFLNTN